MVRAWRTGMLYSQGVGYSLDEHPLTYVLGCIGHGIGAGLLLWFATGHDGPSLLRLVGIDPDMVARWCFG
jgi:hypothetical protein